MPPVPKPTRRWFQLSLGTPDYALFAILAIFATTNVISIALATPGSVFNVLGVFAFVGPLLGIFGVVIVQFARRTAMFRWPTFFGFIGAMIVAGGVNLCLLIAASAAV
jgi:hypothetical protein